MKTMFHRLYSDYLMPSRLARHEELVRAAHGAGYAQMSVRGYLDLLRAGATPGSSTGKILVHRHDIDTDLRTTRKLFELEQRQGITSSFYFRLSTLDLGLMRDIEAYGSEASYHYEELATYAKQHKIKDGALLRQRLPEIRAHFADNFSRIEQQLGRKMRTVASHGDFANRRLKIDNTEILADRTLRERCGIDCESYDRAVLDHFDIYIADRPAPQDYYPTSPFDAIRGHRRICLLTHPRQFETNWKENTKDNFFRVVEGLAW